MVRTLGPALASAALLVAAGASGQPEQTPFPTLPIAVTVADQDGGAVVGDEWLDEQVRSANEIFSPQGVTFRLIERHAMDSSHALLEDRRDRHALGHLGHPGRIDLFVVRSLRDVDDPSRYRQGVHWRPRGEAFDARAHYVIMSSIAGPTVLAHELGHYFGNAHSDTPGNIMSYERGEVPPFFDDGQRARIRAYARRFLRQRQLIAADELSPPTESR